MNKTLALIGLLSICLANTLSAQTTFQSQVGHARLLGVTKPLSEMPPVLGNYNKTSRKAKMKQNKPAEVPNFSGNVQMSQEHLASALPKGADPLVKEVGFNSNSSLQVLPQLVFDGISEDDSQILPPDPSGYIGTNHFIQTTNYFDGTIFEIFDKDGNSVYGPSSTAPFWEDFNITGFGDPVVIYDHEFDRWLITEFGPFGTTVFLVAVSATSDPLGSWYAYEFQAPDFPDYPKYSVWNNSYFITSNEGDSNIPVYALNRAQMLAGAATADMVRLPALPKFQTTNAFQVATPVTWDGTMPPPANEPGYVVRIYDDAWEGGNDGIELWQINIDWNTPSNSSATGPIFLQTAPFDSKICNGSIFDCIAQPDGSTISALEQIIMHRAQYRNFGTHESIVLNHVVDVDGNDLTGIRWYELRRVGNGNWTIFQQGTYTQPDGNHRFMASIAMDQVGNMLMGYSITGPDQLLSLRYTGRLASDPLGEMTVEEYEFGTGLSINPFSRWGDYACMSVDPIDQRTFWFTGEYMLDNGNWGTKIMKALIQRDSNDISPSALITPQNSGYLTNAEPVKVAIRNYGYKPMADYSVGLVFNGDFIGAETIPDTLMPDSIRYLTFSQTVDMSVIGAYPFTIYTSHALDTTFVNDTLRVVVSQLPRNDAAIIGINGIDFPICGTEFSADILLQNTGVDTLFSAIINYQINGGTTFTINWTGVVPPGQYAQIPVTSSEVVAGANSIIVYVEQPNGVPDENPSNDELTRPFTMVLSGSGITLELLTDGYPSETTWELFNLNGEVIFSGGPYTAQETLHTIPMCVEEGCYTFSIYDEYGDGMYWPPSGIMGNYQIFNADGQLIANLAEAGFGFQEDNDFCTDGTCGIELNSNVSFESAPNSNDGSIIFNVQNGVGPYQFSINNGNSFQTTPLFTNLSDGVYQVQVKDASGCLMKDSVYVGTCTLQSSLEVSPATNSNSNDGAIEVTTVNGFPPYQYRLIPGSFQSTPLFSMLDEGTYVVEIVDSVGCSNVFTITVPAITGTQSVTYGTSVKIYPNPTDGVFRIDVKTAGNLDVLPVKVIDASGKVVLHHRLVSYNGVLTSQISLKAYPAGVYYLQLYDEKAGLNQLVKVVKN